LKWSLTVSYTKFPDESDYAIADFTARVTDNNETGESTLSLSGSVSAQTEAAAVTKLGIIRTAVLTARSFAANQSTTLDQNFREVESNSGGDTALDGKVFVQLTFSESYRKRMASIESYTLRISENQDAASGLIRRSYAGTVTSSGATADAAYLAAAVKARALGDNKHSFRMAGEIIRTDRRTLSGGTIEHISVSFNFEYRVKYTRGLLEFKSALTLTQFGIETETVSGYVVHNCDATSSRNLSSVFSLQRKSVLSNPLRCSPVAMQSIFKRSDQLFEVKPSLFQFSESGELYHGNGYEVFHIECCQT